MQRAISSLPVPASPVTSTQRTGLAAIRFARLIACLTALLVPTNASNDDLTSMGEGNPTSRKVDKEGSV
jgi:hypothetical protein